ncbi:unnamed protein product [Clonostachys rosea]|uniref:Uncharacterized protein n=1 Tax=Bionectria ochroleuca TaxID=29856 RepID=A0ABY6UMF0_BIOOC|nr:unnamed protein product [Clonostachys rosea]
MVGIKHLTVATLVWLGLTSQAFALGIDEADNALKLVERNQFDYGAGGNTLESRGVEARGSPPSTPRPKPKTEPKMSPKDKKPSNIRQDLYDAARRQRRQYLELMSRATPPPTPKSQPKMSPKKDKGTNRSEQQRQQDAAHALLQMANGNRRQRREFLELMSRATPPPTPKSQPKMSPKKDKGTNRSEQQRQQDAAHALIHMANGNPRQRREFLELITRATPPPTPKTQPKIDPKDKKPSNIRQDLYDAARRQRREYFDFKARRDTPSSTPIHS